MDSSINRGLAEIRERYGADSLLRVEAMLVAPLSARHSLQRQAKWIMPGLPSKPWHDPYEYAELLPIVRALENAHPEIKAEFARALQTGSGIQPYHHYKGVQRGWNAMYMFREGQPQEVGRTAAPRTFRLMCDDIGDWLCPLLEMHFSVLAAGARIRPHCDLWNFTINLHLAVDIPPNCGLRVADVDHLWQEGRCILFDYSYLHEAWNEGDRLRTCLLVDLWHPALTLAERDALTFVVKEIRKMAGG